MEVSPPKTALRHWLFLLLVACGVLALDQLTKWLVVQNLALYETWVPIPALEGVFDITYTRNTGAAFGVFSSAGNLFMVFALIASVFILYYYRQIEGEAWLLRATLGLQLAGALGNAIDRITRGYVVDFIHVFYEPHFDYPIFNVADSAIVMGVGILMLLLWREERRSKNETAAQEARPAPPEDLILPEE